MFDIIIVGAGPAGCVLASRLSEDAQKQVLLIEAGLDAVVPGAEHPDLLSPFALPASNNTTFHWPDLTASAGPKDSPVPYIQGYGVGGASNINGMGADRGQPGDFDEWRDRGAEGWGWDDVIPYFKKLESVRDFSEAVIPASRGQDGPMPVRRVRRSEWGPFSTSVAAAIERRGFPFLEDYNTDFRSGFSEAPTNGLLDRRVSAPMAYLTREVRARKNLTILTGTKVSRVIFEGKRATGVWVSSETGVGSISGREVALTCGALQTPTLLMRSGLGPGKHLQSLGIDVIEDLPSIGANLQNHPCILLTTYLSSAAAQAPDSPSFLQHWMRYSSKHPGCHENDMHLMTFNKLDWHRLGARVGALAITVLAAYSKGCVALTSRDASAGPEIRFAALSDERDFERLVLGLRFILELLLDPEVRRLRHELFTPDEHLAASLSRQSSWNAFKARAICSMLDIDPLRRALMAKASIDPKQLLSDDAALRSFVRDALQMQYHVCGTCRMGSTDDPSAVVDSTGAVRNVQGLYVADASIFPTIPRGYLHFIVLMAAEKIADHIKLTWDKQP